MSFDVDRKIAELKEKCPDPRDPAGVMHFREKARIESCPPTYGIVVDNRDPECLGRLRVMLPLVAPDRVTPWYSVLGHNKKNKSGWWVLPDIGTQVIVCFPYKRYSHGVVLGCIYDMKHRPPSHSTENPSDSYLIQTKNHRLEIMYCLSATWTKTTKLIRCIIHNGGTPYDRKKALQRRRKISNYSGNTSGRKEGFRSCRRARNSSEPDNAVEKAGFGKYGRAVQKRAKGYHGKKRAT